MLGNVGKIGNRIIDHMYTLLMIFFFLFGFYTLWDMWMINHDAFTSNELLKYKPTTNEDSPLTLNDLVLINEDTNAWLTIDNTHIDYPVVQGITDMEYVNKSIFKEFSVSGAIFLCSENDHEYKDTYNLVYGHHMDNGAMFGDIDLFLEKDFFEENSHGLLTTLNNEFDIEVFAILETDAHDPWVFHNPKNIGKENVTDFVSYIKDHATNYKEIEVDQDTQLIAFATCASYQTNARSVLIGRLIKHEEME